MGAKILSQARGGLAWQAAGLAILLVGGGGLAARVWVERPPEPPLGLPPVRWPAENPYSRRKAELGRMLFFDKRLSSDGTVACASCHDPARAFTDHRPVTPGIAKRKGRRNAPAVLNRAYSEEQLWDARAASLEEQAKGPLADRAEMTAEATPDAAHRTCVERVRAIPGYRRLFRGAFGTEEFGIDHVSRALATFERTLFSGNAPYDRYQAGDRSAMTPSQVRGQELFFGKALCSACHSGPNFTDEIPANTGVGQRQPRPDRGRLEITHHEWETGFFKTPTLREVARTAPYMHDGSIKTLEKVVEHYDRGGGKNSHLDERLVPLHLTAVEKRDLVAFLRALSGEGWRHARAPGAAELPR